MNTANRKNTIRDLFILLGTEVIILDFIFIPAWLGRDCFFVAVAFISVFSFKEIYSKYLPNANRIKKTGIFISIIITLFIHQYFLFFFFETVVLIFILFFVQSIFSKDQEDLSIFLMCFIYTVIFSTFILKIYDHKNFRILNLVFLYGVVEINDSMALVFGKLFGRKKIFPVLSPNKTYFGVVAGLISAYIFAFLINPVTLQFTIGKLIMATTLIVLFTFLGDLVASKIKRSLNIKDFGNILLKQGGVLDIYDSLIFVAPVYFILISLYEKF